MTARPRRSAFSAALAGRGLGTRLIAGFLLAFQLFAVGAVPVLDAETDHSAKVVLHVEDAEQNQCPVSHDLADCQLCQVVTAVRGVPAAAASAPKPSGSRAAPLPMDVWAGAPALVFLSGNSSRAPPCA